MSSIFVLANLTVTTLAMAGGQPAEVVQQPLQISDTTRPAVVKESKVEVTVKKGDTLSKIAQKYDTTWKRLFDANKNIENPDIINPGDKLRIPTKDEKLKSRRVASKVATPAKINSGSSRPMAKVKFTPVTGNSVWDRLAQCESGGNWSINTGNGYYGGLQFTLSTWRSVGGSGYPHQASREEQIHRGKILQARSGWGQWPACTAQLGLR